MSTVRRVQLGSELRRLRDAAGIKRDQAAVIIDCTPGNITHLETGRNLIKKSDLDSLCRAYSTGADVHAVLEELRQEAKKTGRRGGWWSTLDLPEWLQAYLGLEAEATAVQAIELELIHGLLQTEGYAHAVHSLSGHPAATIDDRVTTRMRRQDRLTDAEPLRLSVIMSESALRRCGWHPSCDQIDHLIRRAQLPNVSVRVLPFSAGIHPSMMGTFSLLDFGRGPLPRVAYQDNIIGGQIVDNATAVAELSRLYEHLKTQALDPETSLAFMSELNSEERKP